MILPVGRRVRSRCERMIEWKIIMLMFIGYCILIASGILLLIYSLFKVQYWVYQSALVFIGITIIAVGIRFFLDFNYKYFKNPGVQTRLDGEKE